MPADERSRGAPVSLACSGIMRIWSLHPKYLDAKGLVALWREALLAKHVLDGKTKGYRRHPQLWRFRCSEAPVASINRYLEAVYDEATLRGYFFDRSKVDWGLCAPDISVTVGQVRYEIDHLMNKLKQRDPRRYLSLRGLDYFDLHPLFTLVDGGIADWEIVK